MKKLARAVKKLLGVGRVKEIPASRHRIAPSDIDIHAVDAVKKLQSRGYEGYIVGGAVRDLLLGIKPKDFDISTDATPEQVKKLFGRRSRIIGRRFRIVHLFVQGRRGRAPNSYIEVTTFRGAGGDVVTDRSGRILSDNSYGSADDDCRRRDFTCNALLYNPVSGVIIDHVGGYDDIRSRKLRVIGSPPARFRQDPVRMLRALRLQNKLGLDGGAPVRRAIRANAASLADITPSRLFDEIPKIVNSGAVGKILAECKGSGILKHFLPGAVIDGFSRRALADSDRRFARDKEVSLSFLMGALFWPETSERWLAKRASGTPPVRAMEHAVASVEFNANRVIPRRLIGRIMDLYFLMARLEARTTYNRAAVILRHPMLHRAIKFAGMRPDKGGPATARWWTEYKAAGPDERREMLKKRP